MSSSDDLTPPIYVPGHLCKYLVETHVDPIDRVLSVRAIKEQKVRYLYRRFLSQISYGCKNPNCAARTCLSYRKRVSLGVIRPYTSLSANALALQCVEDYDEQSQKNRPQQSHCTGLCNNEPIIPWYDTTFDPPDHGDLHEDAADVTRRSSEKQPKEKKDHAAFTQQLFDQPQLRQLQAIDLEAILPDSLASRVKGKQKAGRAPFESDRQVHLCLPKSGTSHCLLGTISAQVLDWFRYRTGISPDERIHAADLSEVRQLKQNSQFLDRSVAYIFSHPRKLASSVMRWGGINGRHVPDESPEILPTYPEMRHATFILCRSTGGDTTRLLNYSFVCLQHPHFTYLSTHPDAIYGKDALALTRELAQLILFHEAIARSTRGYLVSWVYSEPTLSKQMEHRLFDRHTLEIGKIIAARLTMELAATAQRRSKIVKLGHAMISVIKSSSAPDAERLSSSHGWADFFSGFLYRLFADFWNYNPIVQRSSPTYAALEMLRSLHGKRVELGIRDALFNMPMPEETFDELEMPYEWYQFKPTTKSVHILQYPFIFSPETLVMFFRSLNFKLMNMAHEKAMTARANAKAQLMYGPWHPRSAKEVMDSLRPHMAKFFVMTVRRDHILEDSIGQIWQREAQEITRPLRVKLGEDNEEEGLDHGGVQQELFRLMFAEAFDDKYGMFMTDPTTHMSWFNPASLEPLYKYEALGVLLSMAIYNGVVVPITFPLAFYRKVLGLKVKLIDNIRDGWPEIARSFDQLLEWSEGDVKDAMSLSYEFGYQAFGERKVIDMSRKDGSRSPSPLPEGFDSSTEPETPAVTNENRKMFVKDYISHLTDITIRPQFTAFVKGLRRLLIPEALSLFAPYVLKQLIEGQPTNTPLDLYQWQCVVDYDNGYSPASEVIQWFWDILANEFDQGQLRSLLAFVTASDRLPIGGWSGMTFTIIKNGDDDGRLPTSSTCYGKLLLPQYSSRQILKDRLEWACSQAWGFWMI